MATPISSSLPRFMLFPLLLLLAIAPPSFADRGQWSPDAVDWSEANPVLYAVHLVLLPGVPGDASSHSRLLWWRGEPSASHHSPPPPLFIGREMSWNPGNDGCATFPSGSFINRGAPPSSGLDVFCAGHAGLADGRLLIPGGTHPRFGAYGENKARIFSRGEGATTGSWFDPGLLMKDWRWYPSATTLRDGRILVTSGAKYRHLRFYGGRRNGLAPSSPTGDSIYRFAPVEGGQWDKAVLPEPDGIDRPTVREGHTLVEMLKAPSFLFSQVLFGGKDSTGNPLFDTWRLARDNTLVGDEHRYLWRKVTPVPADQPDRRSEHTAIAAGDRMVVFGGLNADGSARSDVWSLRRPDQVFTWSLVSVSGSGPGARYGHAAIYDQTLPGINRMIVFGGAAAQGQTPTDSKVWQLRFDPVNPNLATWDSVPQLNFGSSALRPAPRYWHRMVMTHKVDFTPNIRPYPPDTSKSASAAFMFGGALGGTTYSDTMWVLWLVSDGTARWERRVNSGTAPAARARHSLTSDYDQGDLVHIFGGENGSGLSDPYVHVVGPMNPASQWEQWVQGSLPVTGHTGVLDADGLLARVPDLYDPVANQWQEMAGAGLMQYTYPPTFVVPGGGAVGGRVISFAREGRAYRLDLPNTGPFGPWQEITSELQELQPTSGASYRPGRLMVAGGFNNVTGLVTGTTRRLDAQNLGAALQPSADMLPRMRHNLVLLPTGQVLAVGGVSGTSTEAINGVYRPQIWYPDSNGVGVWSDVVTPATRLASQPRLRNYHSTALLLPDGRVLSAGGEGTSHKYLFDMFCPPYLFKGDGTPAARPVIDNAPASLSWRDSFTI